MTRKIRNILYATDLSMNSVHAFPFAVDFARLHNAKIVILHAIEHLPGVVSMHSDLKAEKEYYQELAKESEEKLRATIESECQKIEADTGSPCASSISKVLTPVGSPAEEILVSADKEACDMIVMGTHGKGFLKGVSLGSVAHAVSQKSRIPVVVVALPSLQ
jgi:nucleotide-binding universal stress UspA family protein